MPGHVCPVPAHAHPLERELEAGGRLWCRRQRDAQFGGYAGDGTVQGPEGCDDANAMSGDGCSSDCLLVEPGFICMAPGQACSIDDLASVVERRGGRVALVPRSGWTSVATVRGFTESLRAEMLAAGHDVLDATAAGHGSERSAALGRLGAKP